jgi:hypothetical protein
MALPRFFTVNDRPVKAIDLPDGGLDVFALDMRTGTWVRAIEYLDRYFKHDADVEILSRAELESRVVGIRKQLGVPEFD